MEEQASIGRPFSPGRGLAHGMTAVRVATGPLWLGGLLMAVTDGGGCNFPTGLPDLGSDDEATSWLGPSIQAWQSGGTGSIAPEAFVAFILAFFAAIAFVAIVIGIALFCVRAWAHTGFIRLHAHVLEHANDALGPLFSGKDRFWAMAGWKLLSGLTLSATFLVFAWPGALVAYLGYRDESTTQLVGGIGFALIFGVPALVFTALGIYLGDCAVVLERASPITALRRAWALARGNRFGLFWFAFVCFLVDLASLFGIVLCCIGLLATVPLALAMTGFAKTESFLLLTRGSGPSAGWKLWHRHRGVEPAVAPPATPPATPPGAAPPSGASAAG